MQKLQYIDSLRGWAVIGVLLVHCIGFGTGLPLSPLQQLISNGGHGVQLFFVVSAFTLFLSLNRRHENANNGAVRNFYIRRFFRIAPMFYLAIIYFVCERYFFGVLAFDNPPPITSSSIVSTIFFMNGLSPYWINTVVPGGWTISVEVMFYCFVPFLFSRIKTINQAIIFFFISIIIQHVVTNVLKIIPISSDWQLTKNFLYYYFPNQLPVFACGILMYFLITVPRKDWKISPLLICLFSMGILFQIGSGKELYSDQVIYGMGFVLLAYALSQQKISLIVNSITAYLGKISFSMYLVHFVVLHLMSKWSVLDLIYPLDSGLVVYLNFGIRFVLLLFVSVIVSSITYNCIEVPFQNLGRSIINRLKVGV